VIHGDKGKTQVMELNQQPNILFVMVDQLIPFLTAAYGHPVVQTPSMMRMAREGVLFNAYTPYPLCGPARAAFMTSKYASQLGVYDNAAAFSSEELTIAHYLGGAGYDCVASGKLHFVGPDQLHGFSRRLTTDIYPEDYSWIQNRDPKRAADPATQGNHAFQYTGEAIHVGEWRSNLSFDEETQFRSLEYLRAKGLLKRRNRAEGRGYQPFFLYTSFHHPHDPFWPPQEQWDLYEGADIVLPDYPSDLEASYSILDRWLNQWHQVARYDVRDAASLCKVRRAYYALVSYVDHKLGELLNALTEHDLAEDTVVVFASDHGDMLGEKGMVQKRNFYEWSCRVPLIIRFPDRRNQGSSIAHPVSLLDLLPTFLDIAGVEEQFPFEGHSLLSLINGTSEGWDIFAESHAEGIYGTCFMLRTGQYKYIHIVHEDGEENQLFDLESDPNENVNLSRDSAYQVLAESLKNRLFERFDPAAIEADIQRRLRLRTFLKKWSQQVGVVWDYIPAFDARRKTSDQYLP
jgi:choline-sulfatase